MAGTINFTKESLLKLKDAYALAVTEGRDQFTFEGHELLTSYAKYLIEYLTLDKLAFQLSWRTNNGT
jgi:hypothetical protein